MYCCGIQELGEFGNDSLLKLERQFLDDLYDIGYFFEEMPVIATTTPDQKGAIKFLQKHRFKKIKRWKGRHGTYITLWWRGK